MRAATSTTRRNPPKVPRTPTPLLMLVRFGMVGVGRPPANDMDGPRTGPKGRKSNTNGMKNKIIKKGIFSSEQTKSLINSSIT